MRREPKRTAQRSGRWPLEKGRLPREQRVCCIASRSHAQSGAPETRRKERRPTRAMRRNWQPTGPWGFPNGEDKAALPQLEVEGPSGFDAVVGSFRAKTGIGVDAIHPSVWSRISENGKQSYTVLLNDVERTLTWPAQIQTLIYFLVQKTLTGERPIGLMPSIMRVWERMRKPILDQWMISQTRSYDWACKGRSAEMATSGAGGRAR